MTMRKTTYNIEVQGKAGDLANAIDAVIASAQIIRAELDRGDIPTTAGAGSRLVASASDVLRHLAELATMRRLASTPTQPGTATRRLR